MESGYRERYERLERIGNGTYGVIYLVRCRATGKTLIAKHIALHNLDKAKALQEVLPQPPSCGSCRS